MKLLNGVLSMFHKKNKKTTEDEICWNLKNAYADFGKYRLYNKDVAARTAKRMAEIRPNKKHFRFDEVASEALQTFAIMAQEEDRKHGLS